MIMFNLAQFPKHSLSGETQYLDKLTMSKEEFTVWPRSPLYGSQQTWTCMQLVKINFTYSDPKFFFKLNILAVC